MISKSGMQKRKKRKLPDKNKGNAELKKGGPKGQTDENGLTRTNNGHKRTGPAKREEFVGSFVRWPLSL